MLMRIADEVIFRVLGDEAVILNLATSQYFGLNSVGTRLWQLIAEHGSEEKVCIQGGIDWEILGAKARRLGWEDVLLLSLGVCRTLSSTPVPGEFPYRRLPPWLALFPAEPSLHR